MNGKFFLPLVLLIPCNILHVKILKFHFTFFSEHFWYTVLMRRTKQKTQAKKIKIVILHKLFD